jgi:hypothetical protein
MLDPKRHQTWTALDEHPACPDPGQDVYQWYVHVDPPLPVAMQRAAAQKDLASLAATCEALEWAFGVVEYELIVQDDMTTFVKTPHTSFELSIYPGGQRDESWLLAVHVERPDMPDPEWYVTRVEELIRRLRSLI